MIYRFKDSEQIISQKKKNVVFSLSAIAESENI